MAKLLFMAKVSVLELVLCSYSTGSRYCILMCIYHAIPLLDYNISGQAGQLLCTSVDDLPIPEFDNIGMEAVPAVQLI